MTILLTQAIRVSGSVLAAGTQQTLSTDVESDLIARGFATNVLLTDSTWLRSDTVKSSDPTAGPLKVPRSALTKSMQTILRISSTEIALFSNHGKNKWMRVLKTGVFTSSSSTGVASQFWRLVRLIKLLGAVSVPTISPATAGSFTTAARDIFPNPTAGGQVTASGVVYGSSTQNDAITWSVTVPASGIMQALLLNSSGAAQEYTVTCGGQTKSGTLQQSTSTGLLPQIITLTGCSTGAQTLSVTKTGPSGVLYTTGMCCDVSVIAPASDSAMVYWFNSADKYIDGNGSNDIAVNINGTFAGSYHGGHYGSTSFYIDGTAVDLLSNGPVFIGNSLQLIQPGRINTIAARFVTEFYADGHTFDYSLRADSLSMTEVHLLMSGCIDDMKVFNGAAVPANSQYHIYGNNDFIDMATQDRVKAMTAYIESIVINNSYPTNMYSQAVNTGSGGYVKGYCTAPVSVLSSIDLKTTVLY